MCCLHIKEKKRKRTKQFVERSRSRVFTEESNIAIEQVAMWAVIKGCKNERVITFFFLRVGLPFSLKLSWIIADAGEPVHMQIYRRNAKWFQQSVECASCARKYYRYSVEGSLTIMQEQEYVSVPSRGFIAFHSLIKAYTLWFTIKSAKSLLHSSRKIE